MSLLRSPLEGMTGPIARPSRQPIVDDRAALYPAPRQVPPSTFPGLVDVDADPALRKIRERRAEVTRRAGQAEARLTAAAAALADASDAYATVERNFYIGDLTDRKPLDAAAKQRDRADAEVRTARAAIDALREELDRTARLEADTRAQAIGAARSRVAAAHRLAMVAFDKALHAAALANDRLFELEVLARDLGWEHFNGGWWPELVEPGMHNANWSSRLEDWRRNLVNGGVLDPRK